MVVVEGFGEGWLGMLIGRKKKNINERDLDFLTFFYIFFTFFNNGDRKVT